MIIRPTWNVETNEPYADPPLSRTVTLQHFNNDLHQAMRERARKRRVSVVLLYEEAVERYLNQPLPEPKRVKK